MCSTRLIEGNRHFFKEHYWLDIKREDIGLYSMVVSLHPLVGTNILYMYSMFMGQMRIDNKLRNQQIATFFPQLFITNSFCLVGLQGVSTKQLFKLHLNPFFHLIQNRVYYMQILRQEKKSPQLRLLTWTSLKLVNSFIQQRVLTSDG